MRSEHPAWRVVALAAAVAVACSGPEDAADPAPVVSAIEPACGDSSTPTPVIVRGSLPVQVVISISDPDRNEMDATYRAWVGPVELTAVKWTSSGELRAVVPPGIAPGTWGVTVEGPSGKRGSRDGLFEVRQGACPVQSAALVIANPVAAPATTVVGEQVTVTANVQNDGLAAATNVAASIVSAPAGLTLVQGPAGPQDIPSGQARTFTWTYGTITPTGGVFVIDATGTASDTGQPVAAAQKSTNAVLVNQRTFLTAETVAEPEQATVGQLITVALTATNHATSAAVITPSMAAAGPVTPRTAPKPASIAAGSTRAFVWTYTGNAPGNATFTASISGMDPGTGELVTLPTAEVNVAVQSAPALSATLTIPVIIELGDFTVTMLVSNGGGPSAANVDEVVPDPPSVHSGSTASVTLKSGPTGSPATVITGQPDVPFTWVFTATARGTLVLTSTARGRDANLGTLVVSATVSSNQASVGRFSVGGEVSGYSSEGLVLQNGTEVLPIPTGARRYTFPTAIPAGVTYDITVATQPTGPETCTVANGSRTMGSADVTDVDVTCSKRKFTVGGTLGGLAGAGLMLHNGGDDLPVTANGSFTFPTPVASGGSYDVTVAPQPTGPSQYCTVTGGSGVVLNGPVTTVSVNCVTNEFTVGGTVNRLSGAGLMLHNGSDGLPVTADGPFTFPTRVTSGGSYDVTVSQQPTGPSQHCTVTGGSGVILNGPVTTVIVNCLTNEFTVGGMVNGLSGTGLMLNNGGNDLPVTVNGSFQFPTPVASGGGYDVTVSQQPTGPSQHCTVTGGSGVVLNGPVTTVSVNCATNEFTVGGTVSGLSGTGLMLHNGGDDLPVTTDGSFQFPTPVASGGNYAVSVAAQPTGPSQNCAVANGSGTVRGANVTSVDVTCTTATFTVSVAVTGLLGQGLSVQNNGGDDLAVGADGTFTFPTRIASGAGYDVAVSGQPIEPTQICTPTNGSGIVGDANVTVPVSCALSP